MPLNGGWEITACFLGSSLQHWQLARKTRFPQDPFEWWLVPGQPWPHHHQCCFRWLPVRARCWRRGVNQDTEHACPACGTIGCGCSALWGEGGCLASALGWRGPVGDAWIARDSCRKVLFLWGEAQPGIGLFLSYSPAEYGRGWQCGMAGMRWGLGTVPVCPTSPALSAGVLLFIM